MDMHIIRVIISTNLLINELKILYDYWIIDQTSPVPYEGVLQMNEIIEKADVCLKCKKQKGLGCFSHIELSCSYIYNGDISKDAVINFIKQFVKYGNDRYAISIVSSFHDGRSY